MVPTAADSASRGIVSFLARPHAGNEGRSAVSEF